MGQAHSSEQIKDNSLFTITTKAHPVKTNNDGDDDRKNIFKYLTSPAFKKRVLHVLNSNFLDDKKIKISISNISVGKNLNVKIQGKIDVINKKNGEMLYLVKDGLKTALPHDSATGEHMPSRKSTYRISFHQDDTKVVIT